MTKPLDREGLAVEIARAWSGLPMNAGELAQNYPQEQACYRVADMVLNLLAAELERCAKVESGWLIESKKDNGQITYLTIENELVAWTTDSTKALRFARRQDADMFAFGLDYERITEHQWG